MTLDSFLAHAIKLEYEAETVYRRSAEIIDAEQNAHAVAFFREMAGYAQLHAEDVRRRAGRAGIASLPETAFVWDKGAAPESIAPAPVLGDIIDLDSAMKMALAAEQRSANFYASVAGSAADPEVRRLAEEFASEERAHVLAIEQFMGLKPY